MENQILVALNVTLDMIMTTSQRFIIYSIMQSEFPIIDSH